ncbi:MAG: hypothetical protein AAF383_26825 [Cyanobacteria bacterium P01_A01_bin.83]
MIKVIYFRFCCCLLVLIILTAACVPNQQTDNSNTENKFTSASIPKAKLGKSRSLSTDFMCYDVNSTQVEDWSDLDFIAAVQDLYAAKLRIPGGDVGNYWDWQRGGLIENADALRHKIKGLPAYTQEFNSLPTGLPFFLRFKTHQYTASKLSDFLQGLNATNTEPIFVLNMLTSSLESQLEMLRYARDLGIEIKQVELGNKFYFDIPNYQKTFSNPRAYGLTAKAWTEAIKQEFPDAQIAIVGVVPNPDKPPRLQHWNKVMRGTVLPIADAITLHIYNGHGLDTPPQQTDIYPYFETESVPIILGEPFRNWQKLIADSNYQAIPDNKKIWITEYNLFEDIFSDDNNRPIPRVAGSWTHGLYNLATSLLFLEESRIESICNHSLIESSLFGAILNTRDSFINPADKTMQATPMSLSATGSALSLLGQATQEMTNASPIELPLSTQLTGKNNFAYPALYGWHFSNATKQTAIVLNLSDQRESVDFSALFADSKYKYRQVSALPQDLVNHPDVFMKSSQEGNNLIVLPAYSVTLIAEATETNFYELN